MIKVNCEACGAPYDVDPRRIPASGLKMRCPACGTTFHVHPAGSAGAAQKQTAEKLSAEKQTAQDALDLDLPAPKLANSGARAEPRAASSGGSRGAFGQATPQTRDFADLPAVKGRRGESLPENIA